MAIGEELVVDGLAGYRPILEMVTARLGRSVCKHGDWSDYSAEKAFEAVAGEFDEYREAFICGQVGGAHGQVEELLDVAVVAIKEIGRLLG